ncbi:hypothetical protein EVC24_097 [Rhizobium phage RHph_I4]|nr:hypothetical protein EVC24_097 [Rhizobium phage RHph_I4]
MTDTPGVRTRSRVNPSNDPADAEQPAPDTSAMNRRTRVSMATGSRGAEPQGEDTSWMHTGDAGAEAANRVRQERAAQDAEAAKRPVKPMRFKLAWNFQDSGYGETADIVILDDKPGPRFWEHTARNPRTGYWTEFEQCPHEWDNCPLCPPEGEKAPYYVMMLTVIDMREFTDREGRVWAATRKLLPVKIEQQGFFDDLYKQHGSLRGIRLIMTRDGGKMSSPIGNNIQFDCVHTEEDMAEYCKSVGLWEEYKQDNGRVIWGEGEFINPYQYGKIFEKPSGAKLRLKYNPDSQGAHIGGRGEQQGDGWRRGTEPGRAAGNSMANRGSQRRVNLEDRNTGGTSQDGGAGEMDDNIPF